MGLNGLSGRMRPTLAHFALPTQYGATFGGEHRRSEMKPKAQKILSAVVGAIGLALLIMMIATEGEPGAIPLAMLLIGAVGHISGRLRERALRER
jgi:lipoprotein signal peptidase